MSEQAELLGVLAAHLVLIALPGAAAALYAANRGVREVPVLPCGIAATAFTHSRSRS